MATMRNLADDQNGRTKLVAHKVFVRMFGINRAILFGRLAFWLAFYEEAEKENPQKPGHFHDNRWWVFNSYPKWSADLLIAQPDGIKAMLVWFVDMELVLRANYNQENYDQTWWYSVNWDACDELYAFWLACGEPEYRDGRNADWHAFIAQWHEKRGGGSVPPSPESTTPPSPGSVPPPGGQTTPTNTSVSQSVSVNPAGQASDVPSSAGPQAQKSLSGDEGNESPDPLPTTPQERVDAYIAEHGLRNLPGNTIFRIGSPEQKLYDRLWRESKKPGPKFGSPDDDSGNQREKTKDGKALELMKWVGEILTSLGHRKVNPHNLEKPKYKALFSPVVTTDTQGGRLELPCLQELATDLEFRRFIHERITYLSTPMLNKAVLPSINQVIEWMKREAPNFGSWKERQANGGKPNAAMGKYIDQTDIDDILLGVG